MLKDKWSCVKSALKESSLLISISLFFFLVQTDPDKSGPKYVSTQSYNLMSGAALSPQNRFPCVFVSQYFLFHWRFFELIFLTLIMTTLYHS